MTFNLFYLANPIYGGWVSFTAHLALKHSLQVYKIGNRTETKPRNFGYGVSYTNIAINDIAEYKDHVITAIDKHYYDKLHYFPDNTFIIIHDPSEVTKANNSELIKHLHRFRIITIRKSVQTYLKSTLGLNSLFLLHPFYPYTFTKDAHPDRAVSISRIDFDKHIDIALDANKHLSAKQSILLYGAANLQYVFFKLDRDAFKKYYKGKFEKTFESLNKILHDAKFVVDMSVIKHDGGGTQYTFLEAIHQECALVMNQKWIQNYDTPFKKDKNCFVVNNGEELADLIKRNPSVKEITASAKKILKPHIEVDWVYEMSHYNKASKEAKAKTMKVKKHKGRQTRRN